MFALKRKIYESSPPWVKQLVGSIPFGWIAGGAYRHTLRQTVDLESASRERLADFQKRQLREILEYATQFVPAYESLKSTVAKYEPEQALLEFPLLDKSRLKENFDSFVSREYSPLRRWESTTGGTTGDQLKFYLDDHAQNREMAFMHAMWRRVGYRSRSRKATFRGVEFKDLPADCYWQLNPIYNECQFTPFHLNPTTIPRYITQLRNYSPQFIHGYPSAVSVLAKHCLRQGIPLADIGIKAVLLGSEAASQDQRDAIESAFATRAFSWYGHSERLVLAGECEHSSSYHHFTNYGLLEILAENGKPCAVGETGEIVGTGFWNRAMPLIRYQTGDRARRLEPRCECGRLCDMFDQVEGRWTQDFVVGKNGSLMSVAALNMHGPLFDQVLRYQYYQNQPGRMVLRVMTSEKFSEQTGKDIEQAYLRKVGAELDVVVQRVASIPLTTRGKLKRLIQEIPN